MNAAKTFQQVSSDYNVMKARIAGLEQQMALIGISSASLKAAIKFPELRAFMHPFQVISKAAIPTLVNMLPLPMCCLR